MCRGETGGRGEATWREYEANRQLGELGVLLRIRPQMVAQAHQSIQKGTRSGAHRQQPFPSSSSSSSSSYSTCLRFSLSLSLSLSSLGVVRVLNAQPKLNGK